MFDPPNMGPMQNDLCNKALFHYPIRRIKTWPPRSGFAAIDMRKKGHVMPQARQRET